MPSLRFSAKWWMSIHLTLFCVAIATQPLCEAVAADLVLTCRASVIYAPAGTAMKEVSRVPRETILVGFQQGNSGGTRYRFVRCPSSRYQDGWIYENDIRDFRDAVKEETENAERSRNDQGVAEGSVPAIIRDDRRPAIRKAWAEIAEVIKENESRPEEKRIPEPYFTRAEIWTAVHNYPDAMRDYLRALRYASSSGRELQTYARYHKKVEVTINRFTRVAECSPSWTSSL